MGPPAEADLADLNLVLAVIKEDDPLKERAEGFLEEAPVRPRVPFAVGVELLLWCRKYGVSYTGSVGACVHAFETEQADLLATAAHALEEGEVDSPFDAVHLASALHGGVRLVTADEGLWGTGYPVEGY